MQKYIVTKNDLKFKDSFNINLKNAIWDCESTECGFNDDKHDPLTYRIQECRNNNYKYIDLSKLKLSFIPDLRKYSDYNKILNIEYLFINDNNLTSLNVSQFKNLTVIDISNNNISELPYLPNMLEELACENNMIKYITDHNKLKILLCSNNKMTEIGNYSQLKTLSCDKNNIQNMKSYNQLEKLECFDNPITNISNQKQLKYIDCSNTKLNKLPCLENVEVMVLNNTNIDDVDGCPKLIELAMSNTKIDKIRYFPLLKCISCKKDQDIMLSNKYDHDKLKFRNEKNNLSIFI